MSPSVDERKGGLAGLVARLPTGARERLADTVSQLAAAGALIVIFIYHFARFLQIIFNQI